MIHRGVGAPRLGASGRARTPARGAADRTLWPQIESVTLADRVYQIIRNRILHRELPPGTFIREQEVSRATGVSRTPVREAFNRLASEDFLERVPHRGFRIPDRPFEALVEVYPIINSLEIGEVKAKDIDLPAGVEILNPDAPIATLEKKTKLEMYLTIGKGRGYSPAEDTKADDQPIGVIPIDSIFSPVRRVSYDVEAARVGQRTDYDKLRLDVTTDGSLEPRDAPAGAMARPLAPQSSSISASTVGRPRESQTCRPCTLAIAVMARPSRSAQPRGHRPPGRTGRW